MLPPLLLITLITCNRLSEGYPLDYPIVSARGNLLILSTLTDQLTQETWTIKETLIVTPQVHGKIELTHGNDKIQVFYHENDQQTRLLIHDNQCYQMKFNSSSNDWDSTIPTVTQPLLNMALLLGPSLYLRFTGETDSFIEDDNVQLRGETMKTCVINIDTDLRLSFLFPVRFTSYVGVRQPKRLILTGKISRTLDYAKSETLFYDIIDEKRLSMSTLDETLITTPTLGIGCSSYLEVNQPFPLFNVKRYHVNLIETIKTKTEIKSTYQQLSVDLGNRITRVTIYSQFDSRQYEQSIIVYNLGIKYNLSSDDNKCKVIPLDSSDYRSSSPSTDNNLMPINPITLDIHDFKYVGQVIIDHDSGLVDVWESTEYNVTFDSTTNYDKIVTTQFMVKQLTSNQSDDSYDYLPIAAERKFYQLHLDKYILIKSLRRDFYDYEKVNQDEVDYLESSFEINNCYDNPDDKMYLTLQISSLDLNYQPGLNYASRNVYLLRETIKQLIATNLNLSYLRITRVDIEFESIYIVARVEIVEAPNIVDSMYKFDSKFDRSSFDNYRKVTIKHPIDCLKAQSNLKDIRYVINCMKLDNLCVSVVEGQSMPESSRSGSFCQVYVNQNDKLRELVQELTLRQLDEQFTQLIGIRFNLACVNCSTNYLYSVENIVRDSPSSDDNQARMAFIDVENGAKLDDHHGRLIEDLGNFADCYRACLSSKGSTCETFSFCSNLVSGQIECRTSENTYSFLSTIGTSVNSSCNIYGKNNLLDYHRLSSVKFIDIGQQPASGLSVRTADECARACVEAKESCYSFQICDYRYCTFGGPYTTSNTETDLFCDIYIPKKISNFVKNNHQIVTTTFHTEVDLTLDQCSSLCFSMRSNNDHEKGCLSFNYCPKGETTSTCQLSSEIISSAIGNQISTSDDCSNYQYIDTIDQHHRQQANDLNQQGSTSSIGVVSFFIIIGFTMGLATPWAHNYFKKRFNRYINQPIAPTLQYENFNDTTI